MFQRNFPVWFSRTYDLCLLCHVQCWCFQRVGLGFTMFCIGLPDVANMLKV